MKKFLIVILTFMLFNISACEIGIMTPIEPDLGYTYKSYYGFINNGKEMYLGATSNINEFDLSNVNINLYYGVQHESLYTFYFSKEKLDRYNLCFGIYMAESETNNSDIVLETYDYKYLNNYILFKSFTEQEMFQTNKYECTITNGDYVEYNYNEAIQIPSQLFTKENGFINIYFVAFYETINDLGDLIYKYYNHILLSLEYSVNDNKIIVNFDHLK